MKNIYKNKNMDYLLGKLNILAFKINVSYSENKNKRFLMLSKRFARLWNFIYGVIKVQNLCFIANKLKKIGTIRDYHEYEYKIIRKA